MRKKVFDLRGLCGLLFLMSLPVGAMTPDAASTTGSLVNETPQSIAAKVLKAHGGREAWEQLHTIYIAREHHLTGAAKPWDYAITAEYGSERLFIDWNYPAGQLVWDGERAWDVNWGPAKFILPRFAMGIGFFAINMPYFINSPDAKLVSLEKRIGQAPGDTKEYYVLGVEYEGRSARKPPFAKDRDLTEIYIDPKTFMIAGTHFNWRYTEQLDIRGKGETEFFQNYVVTGYVEDHGIKWPSTYRIYDRDGSETTVGRYYDYKFDVPIDESVFRPDGKEGVRFDTSSSFQHKPLAE